MRVLFIDRHGFQRHMNGPDTPSPDPGLKVLFTLKGPYIAGSQAALADDYVAFNYEGQSREGDPVPLYREVT